MAEENKSEEKIPVVKVVDEVVVETVFRQTKISVEVKLSKNYNTITVGIQDEPINSSTEKDFRRSISSKVQLVREEVEKQLLLIGSKPKTN